ncbi:MAG TPA: glutamate formimidoyltransferase [Spirochaetia bacterium]|nr:glutamate formimidoyltransferase [Spirochaetales bacterium]HRS66474.1 glutamate formimidoyltransferase [Spirochaetia bacterium]
MRKLVECVPNFSEGRNKSIIDAIARAITSVQGVTLLDVDPGADTNRTVYTFVGTPEAVAEAAVQSAKCAYELIDMQVHTGAHPRMGALDVCPFIPISGITMEECVELSRSVGKRIAHELEVPVYLYEYAATSPSRKSLADIRAGEYEALAEKLQKPEWKPDFGPAQFVPRWGGTVVGAREFLIAYNVNLNTRDKKLANEVALAIREGGKAARDSNGNIIKDASGNTVKVPGRLKNVRAIGWYIDAYKCAQVSINLTNYKETPLHTVFETVKEEAEKLGLRVTGSEIVGLVPKAPLVDAGKYYATLAGKSKGAPEQELIQTAVQTLGLDSVAPFESNKKIIEYAVAEPAPLMSKTVFGFVDEVSADSPAPGGGSVAALAGSLGAALAAMVANLTVGKKGYEAVSQELSNMAEQAQSVKDALAHAVDADTNAFNAVMEAMKLPKATEAEKAAREKALQDGYKAAALVPLETASLCLEALKLAELALKGNKNSITDAGVAGLMAHAGVFGACYNVLINLGTITDTEFVSSMRTKTSELMQQANAIKERINSVIMESIQ